MKATELREYCDNLAYELEGWKEKLDHVVSQFDHVSTGEKEKVVGEINGLHILSDEMEMRLEGLCGSCNTEWDSGRDDHSVVWPERLMETSRGVSVSDIGG